MYEQSVVAVFTLPERCDLFRGVVGDDADFRMNTYESLPLDVTLENLHAGGACIVICDERHFFSIEDLAYGLQAYMDKPRNRGRLLRLVLVCSDRTAGDPWLKFFASYLGIYDIVYGVQGVELVSELQKLLEHPNERVDVLDLLDDPSSASDSDEQAVGGESSSEEPKVDVCVNGDAGEWVASLGSGVKIQIQVNILPA